MDATRELLSILHEMCGNENLPRIALVITMWDGVDEQRTHETLAEVKGGVMDKYGFIHCHSNTPAYSLPRQFSDQSLRRGQHGTAAPHYR